MPKLRVRQVAEAKGLNLSKLQRQSGVTMPSVRRYWYNTRDGKTEGDALKEVDLSVLGAIAKALEVEPGELIEQDIVSPASAVAWTAAPMLAGS